MAFAKKSTAGSTVALLRAISKILSMLSEEELNDLASGEATLVVRKLRDLDLDPDRISKKRDRDIDYLQLQDNLRAVETVQAGLAYLSDAQLTRVELERLARSLDLPVLKQDSVRRLEDKIVEALIGSRLSSRAVRGR